MAHTYIALLRGINVGGNNLVSMAALREFATKLGLQEARTLLQSGNLVFGSEKKQEPAALEKRLEAGAAGCLGASADFMVRDTDEWADVIARNPFPEYGGEQAGPPGGRISEKRARRYGS